VRAELLEFRLQAARGLHAPASPRAARPARRELQQSHAALSGVESGENNDAERRHGRSHAERGNERLRCEQRLNKSPRCRDHFLI